MVLGQQVGEGLIGKLLQLLASVAGQELERLPGLRVEADQLALRRPADAGLSGRAQALGDVSESGFLGVTHALTAKPEESALHRRRRHFLADGA